MPLTSERYWPDKTGADKDDPACAYANVYDRKNETFIKTTDSIKWQTFACDDDFPYTASSSDSTKKFTANKWLLYNMLGNVFEWTQDCYVDNYKHTPTNGSAQESPNNNTCTPRVMRGGSWSIDPQFVRSAARAWTSHTSRDASIGFRLARTL